MKTKYSTLKTTYPLVFLGDSFVHNWMAAGYEIWESTIAPFGAINYGVQCDSTQNLIERIMKNEFPALETATVVVLMIGLIDIRHKIKEQVVLEQMKKIILLIQERKAGVKILIMGMLPGTDVPELRESIHVANNLIATCENGFTVRVFDMEHKFVDESTGEVMEDLFIKNKSGLSAEGYNVWANCLSDILETVLYA